MKRYYIESEHEIFEDSYTEGQLDHKNSFSLSEIIIAENPREALSKYMDFLGCEITDENFERMIREGNDQDKEETYRGYEWSKLVDEDNIYASDREIEQWKKGELTLYSDDFSITIHELNRIDNI